MKKTLLCGVVAIALCITACGNGSEGTKQESNVETVDDAMFVAETETVQEVESQETTTEEVAPYSYDAYEHFDVTSDNVSDGVWDSKITNTDNGENIAPSLKWNAVSDATVYAVYMLDGDWLHMVAYTDKTDFAEGEISNVQDAEYVGPYPPSGTHNYTVYVVALRNKPGEVKVRFDSFGNKLEKFIEALDVDADGATGNVISCGMLDATYTKGE